MTVTFSNVILGPPKLITYVGSATGFGTSSAVVNKPAGQWTKGNLLIAFCAIDDGSRAAPSITGTGWSSIGLTSTYLSSSVWCKFAGASEPASVTFTDVTPPNSTVAAIIEYTNVTFCVSNIVFEGAPPITFSSITSTKAYSLGITAILAVDNVTDTVGTSTGYTNRISVQATGSGSGYNGGIWVADSQIASPSRTTPSAPTATGSMALAAYSILLQQ